MTPRQLLLQSARRLAEAGVPDPEQDPALLLSSLTGRPPLMLRLDMDTELEAPVLEAFQLLLNRRLRREPLQYILGSVSFQGFSFRVDERALIPRPETALLAEWVLERLIGRTEPKVLDLCCGSGCIGLSVKAKRPDANMTLTDISAAALSLAGENADRLHLEASLLKGDLFQPVAGQRFDLIVSNPPYIPSRECGILQEEVRFEPLLALDGGEDGLDFYRRIARGVPGFLRPEGQLMLELGFAEADPVKETLLAHGAKDVVIRTDYSGKERMLLALYD